MELQKTKAYFDDIIVHGTIFDEYVQNLQGYLQILYDYELRVHINQHKCTFMTGKIKYLGHVNQHNQISKSPAKVQAILVHTTSRNWRGSKVCLPTTQDSFQIVLQCFFHSDVFPRNYSKQNCAVIE